LEVVFIPLSCSFTNTVLRKLRKRLTFNVGLDHSVSQGACVSGLVPLVVEFADFPPLDSLALLTGPV
jgi:hypothetical protein